MIRLFIISVICIFFATKKINAQEIGNFYRYKGKCESSECIKKMTIEIISDSTCSICIQYCKACYTDKSDKYLKGIFDNSIGIVVNSETIKYNNLELYKVRKTK